MNRASMDINLARTFLAIVETGNFNRAADQVNVTQSTVSMRIKSLEESLGRPLFIRSKTGTSLTAAGIQFQKYAHSLVRTWEQARHEVALPDNAEGMIVIGGQFTLWDNLILKWIPWMRSAIPEVAIRAEVGLSDGLMRQLVEGILDIGVMYTPQSRSGFMIEELISEKVVMVSTNSETTGPGEPGYVYVDWGPEFYQSYTNAYPDLDAPILSVSHGPLALSYIFENGGSCYLPQRFIRKYMGTGRLYAISTAQEFFRPSFMVYPSDNDDARFETALQGLRYVASLENATVFLKE